MANAMIITSTTNSNLEITALPGHFVTSHSHINYYIDISKMKHHHMMAREAGITLAAQYAYDKEVDTIVCMDGSEIIGAFLAQQLSKNDMLSMNRYKNIYIVTPEYNTNGQMIFRDNLQPMINNKHVLLLIASVTTGKTINRALECIRYYGGTLQGVSAVFSIRDELEGIRINYLFSAADIPNYETYSYRDCPQCKAGIKIDGLANSFGISKM
ncbi:orotate phosphoribosyltransferase [Oscillospiraceae bacterium PP1C4]